MEYSFEQETYFNISEFTEYTKKSYEDLKASKYKVNVNDRLRCLFCPGKKKHDYKLEHLLQHASGEASLRHSFSRPQTPLPSLHRFCRANERGSSTCPPRIFPPIDYLRFFDDAALWAHKIVFDKLKFEKAVEKIFIHVRIISVALHLNVLKLFQVLAM
ncbi:hypothetical protein LWI29_024717 [Acer saccharum]|uniref:Zinc finger-XS domain-containing protein n=1 Tax=Acer saccharum TaxID=4024 RepID=A0AA39SET4_ACESA|nr:hypothetical protein LWI29_024717 [Acer saccharum]